MSDTVIIALISGISSVAGACIAIIPAIVSNRRKTIKEINIKNEQLEKKLDGLELRLDNHIGADKKRLSLEARRRFLSFYDEERHKHRHSREHWMSMLEDIEIYERYCRENPDYPNHKGDIAREYLIKTFTALEESDDFLK